MTQRAKFVGTTGHGYENGQEYKLLISIHQNMFWIQLPGGEARTPYQSLKAFLANWELL